jgi:hypothetical protein
MHPPRDDVRASGVVTYRRSADVFPTNLGIIMIIPFSWKEREKGIAFYPMDLHNPFK